MDVENAAPILSGFPSFVSAEVGQLIDWSVGITDGANDTHTFVWDFGDLTTESGVGLTSVQHAYAIEDSYTASLTVTDNDGLSTIAVGSVVIGAPVSFVSTNQTVLEDAGSVLISAELSNGVPLNQDVTINLAIAGDVSETDYDLFLTQIVILQGQTTGSVEIDIVDNARDENAEDLRLVVDSTDGASIGAIDEFTIEIQDNDDPPSVYFSALGQSIAEDIGTATLMASLNSISGRDVIVPVAFTGSATNGDDYAPQAGSILIPAGAISGSIDVTINDDNAIESAETIVATLQSSPEAILSTETGQPTTVAFIIAANDAPDVSLDSAYRLTTETGPSFFITARLSRFSDELISVPFAISGTAENNPDYRLINGTLEFAPGSSSASIELDMIDDNISESVETAIVELQSAANANLGTTQLTVTDILDDDLVRVSFETSESSQFEGDSSSIKVVLSNPSSSPVIVPVTVSGTASSGEYTVAQSVLTFAPFSQAEYVDVSILDDSIDEPTERVYLSIDQNLTGGFAGDIITHQIDVKDTDPFVSLVRPSSSLFVESDGSVSFTAQLSAPTNEAITVPIKFSGTAKRGPDFTAPTNVVIPAGETSKSFNLSIVDDAATESKENVTVAFANPSAGILRSPTNSNLTIEDNDAPVTV